MIQAILLGIEMVLLIAVLRELRTIAGAVRLLLAKPSAPPVLPAAVPLPAPAALRTDLAEVLHRQHGRWVHHHWVRADSPAFHHALSTPGFAIKSPAGDLQEGAQ